MMTPRMVWRNEYLSRKTGHFECQLPLVIRFDYSCMYFDEIRRGCSISQNPSQCDELDANVVLDCQGDFISPNVHSG